MGMLLTASSVPAQAQTYSVLYSFTGGTDGSLPETALIRDPAGNLYGATVSGGDLYCGAGLGCGVVFKLDPTGNETVLHSFSGQPDGDGPFGDLVRDAAGNLCGSTYFGGAYGSGGAVFRLDDAGGETLLYSFTGEADGRSPGGLVRDTAGNLYGTTSYGGSRACMSGCGVVFRVDQAGNETVLHSFAGGATDGCPTRG